MGALISSNTLRLEPDGLSFQTGKVQLPLAPSNANTMVFYYKAYFENIVLNIGGGEIIEDATNYAWNNDAFFGLSFSGTVSANTGGILGFTNITENNILRARQPGNYIPFGNNSGYLAIIPCALLGDASRFSYGPNNNGESTISVANNSFLGGQLAPSTHFIGLSGAKKYLGIIKVAKHEENSQNIVISYGNNWENMPASSFSSAISSLSSNWAFQNINVRETVNFRPNHANPALSNTINFPRWIVAKWPSAVLDRNFVVTDVKIEYYT